MRRPGGGQNMEEEGEGEGEEDCETEILLKPSDRLALRLQAPDQVHCHHISVRAEIFVWLRH
jgi:hypothetical protein